MKRFAICLLTVLLLAVPVSAMELTAPTVPDAAEEYLPREPESLGEGLLLILRQAVINLRPEIAQASGSCLTVLGGAVLMSGLHAFGGSSKKVVELAASLVTATALLGASNSMIRLTADTVTEISSYAKLLLPVMTAAMAAQGGVTGASAMYTATALADAVLINLVDRLLVPGIYVFLALSVANAATGADTLKKLAGVVKWAASWGLKLVLYAFGGYMGLTGVITGTADAFALKTAKVAITGVVPVVGGILSNASETVLISAGMLKNAAGVYGMLAILAITIGPFLKIGVQYLLLKLCSGLCGTFGAKSVAKLVQDFSDAMGLLLAMTAVCCVLMLVSTVCLMRGVG